MNFKKLILNSFQKNTYAADFLYKFYKYNLERDIENLSSTMSKHDTLNDICSLISLKNNIITNDRKFFSYNLNNTASRLYGIHSSIFKSIDDKNIYFPSTEHGLIFHNNYWSDTKDTLRASCLTFGNFRKSILSRHYNTPIFCVGPYIHYAKDYYDQNTFKQTKKKLGKNLLVFPTHSTDDSNLEYDKNNFIKTILDYKNNFDSVTICSFWWNIDDPLLTYLSKLGCNIVSAGYREDRLFLSRLKTLIKLSDFTIGDSIGTHVGYCLYLNKPFSYFQNETIHNINNLGDDENKKFINKHINILKNTFLNSNEITSEQMQIANHYWGFDHVKNSEQIFDIYIINKLITQNCYGFVDNYSNYAHKLLDNNILNENQKTLLFKSLY